MIKLNGVVARALRILFLSAIAFSIPAGAWAESLYSDQQYQSLTADHRARKPGQSLTVMIFEQASAATSADTDASKSFGFSGSVEGNSAKNRNQGSIDLSNDFSGGGAISRTGELVASVSVTIQEVLPSGEFRIHGEQMIELNEEKQYIRVDGKVRPEDISSDNAVLSTRISDANITYVGDGLLGRRQKQGVLSRVFDWLF